MISALYNNVAIFLAYITRKCGIFQSYEVKARSDHSNNRNNLMISFLLLIKKTQIALFHMPQ